MNKQLKWVCTWFRWPAAVPLKGESRYTLPWATSTKTKTKTKKDFKKTTDYCLLLRRSWWLQILRCKCAKTLLLTLCDSSLSRTCLQLVLNFSSFCLCINSIESVTILSNRHPFHRTSMAVRTHVTIQMWISQNKGGVHEYEAAKLIMLSTWPTLLRWLSTFFFRCLAYSYLYIKRTKANRYHFNTSINRQFNVEIHLISKKKKIIWIKNIEFNLCSFRMRPLYE